MLVLGWSSLLLLIGEAVLPWLLLLVLLLLPLQEQLLLVFAVGVPAPELEVALDAELASSWLYFLIHLG